jgi:nucleotidyltransferase-like protein
MSPAAQTLEGRTRVLIERVFDLGAPFRCRLGALVEIPEEVLRRDPAGFLSGGSTDLTIGGDHPDLLLRTVLGGEALDERVRLLSEANCQIPVGRVLADAVEDHHPACAAHCDEARQAVDQLLALPEGARVEDVVAVEEIEHPAKDARMEAERAYLDELVRRLQELLGPELVGVYAGGSWALGGYEHGPSDLDVAVVVRRPLTDEVADRIVAEVRHEAFPCPARGLELVVYTERAAGTPTVEPGFELNLNTGSGLTFRADREPQPGERHWFAIDRSVLSEHGVALLGPPAADAFAPIAPADLRPVLADVLRWYEREAPESEDAVLNAGRSLRFVRDGIWLPKPALRAWAAEEPGTNAEILARAIAELEAG